MGQLQTLPSACSGGWPSCVENPAIEWKLTCRASRQPSEAVCTIHGRSRFPFSRSGGGMKWTNSTCFASSEASCSGSIASSSSTAGWQSDASSVAASSTVDEASTVGGSSEEELDIVAGVSSTR